MRSAAPLAIGPPSVAAALLLCTWSPGLEADRWWPALGLLAAVLVAGAVIRTPSPLSRTGAVALAAAVAWAAWSTLSVTWALDPGWAVEAAGRAWLVAAALAVALWWPARRDRGPRIAVVTLACAGALAGAVAWGQALGGLVLEDGRLRGALPYANGFALLEIVAALAAAGLALAAVRPAARGGWAALTVALLAGAFAAQSRSSPVALGVGVLVLCALRRPARADVLLGAGVLVGLAVAAPSLLDLRLAALDGAAPAQATARALAAIAIGSGLAALVAGAVRPRPRVAGAGRPAGRLRTVGLAAAVALALLPGAVALSSEVDYTRVESSSTRFLAGGGSNRPDMWRVAWRAAAEHPLRGVGAGSFERPYLRLRRAEVAPRFAHGLLAEPAATLGAPGVGLVLILALALLRIAAGGRRPRTVEEAVLAGVVAGLLAHALVDWTLELPVIALALVLAAGALPASGDGRSWSIAARRRGARGAAAAAALAALALLPAALAADRSRVVPSDSPVERVERLRAAAELAPLDSRPLQSLAVTRLEQADPAAGLRAARAAVERAPHDWFALWLAGSLELDVGDEERGRELLARARAANPRESVFSVRPDRSAGGRTLDLAAVRDVLLGQPAPRSR